MVVYYRQRVSVHRHTFHCAIVSMTISLQWNWASSHSIQSSASNCAVYSPMFSVLICGDSRWCACIRHTVRPFHDNSLLCRHLYRPFRIWCAKYCDAHHHCTSQFVYHSFVPMPHWSLHVYVRTMLTMASDCPHSKRTLSHRYCHWSSIDRPDSNRIWCKTYCSSNPNTS